MVGGTEFAELAAEFSISRFDEQYMKKFWERVAGSDNTLEAEAASL